MKMKHWFSVVAMALVLGGASNAFAQEDTLLGLGESFSSTTSSTTLGLLILATTPFTTTSTLNDATTPRPRRRKRRRIRRRRRVEVIMQRDMPALEASLSIGHGSVLQDLATLFEIAPQNYQAFARMMRSQATDLQGTLSSDTKSREQAAENFLTIVELGMAADTVLHTEYLEIALLDAQGTM